MTLADALAWGRARLSGEDSVVRGEMPGLDAEVLLRHVAGVERVALFAHPERGLPQAQWRRYRALVGRRARGEPVAYLTGHREFMGLDLRVSQHVLIPRPETELLVERALARIAGDGAGMRAIDVGTGSGAIAIALASQRPALHLVAVDVSDRALAVARRNARRLLGPGRVRFRCASLLEGVSGPADVITANLPYITSEELDELPVSVREYEPTRALDGGPDGLDLYRELLRQAPATLEADGTLLMECDPRQAQSLAALAHQAFPDAGVEVVRDLAGQDRVVEVRRRPDYNRE